MDTWDELERFARNEADRDLRAGAAAARPFLAAWRGEEPRFLAFLRDFAKGAYRQALIELLALSCPLGVDRLGFATTARAWSLDDPIAPVTDDVDLRQRVLMIESADASAGVAIHRSVLVPFDEPVAGEGVRWGRRRALPGSEGWIASALTLAVSAEGRAQLSATDRDIAEQARRVAALGHDVIWAPVVADRLTRHPVPPRSLHAPRMSNRVNRTKPSRRGAAARWY
jgi:hypothetical protein